MSQFIVSVILFSLPFVFAGAVGVVVGRFGRGERGRLIGFLLASSILVYLPLLLTQAGIYDLWHWFVLLTLTLGLLAWPKRVHLWRQAKAHNIREKRFSRRWKAAAWSERWTLTSRRCKAQVRSSLGYMALWALTLLAPISLLVIEMSVFGYTKLCLLPSLGNWEQFVLLLASQGLLLGVARFFENGPVQKRRALLGFVLCSGLALGILVALMGSWATSWRPLEAVSLEPLEQGQVLYKIRRREVGSLFSTQLTKNIQTEIGLLDLRNGERRLLFDADFRVFARLSPGGKKMLYNNEGSTLVRLLESGREIKVGSDDLLCRWNGQGSSLLVGDLEDNLSLFDLSSGTTRALAPNASRSEFSPRGEQVVYSQANGLQTERLWLADVESGVSRQLTGLEVEGREEKHHRFVSWSYDDRWLVYKERTSKPDQKRRFDLWLLDLEKGSRTLLTRDAFAPMAIWGHSGKLLVQNGEEVRVWSTETLSNRVLKLPRPDSPEEFVDEEISKGNFVVEWLGSTDQLLYRHFGLMELWHSSSLDKDWNFVCSGQGFAGDQFPGDDKHLFRPLKAAETDFFKKRYGVLKWDVLNLENQETTTTITWNNGVFEIEKSSEANCP